MDIIDFLFEIGTTHTEKMTSYEQLSAFKLLLIYTEKNGNRNFKIHFLLDRFPDTFILLHIHIQGRGFGKEKFLKIKRKWNFFLLVHTGPNSLDQRIQAIPPCHPYAHPPCLSNHNFMLGERDFGLEIKLTWIRIAVPRQTAGSPQPMKEYFQKTLPSVGGGESISPDCVRSVRKRS